MAEDGKGRPTDERPQVMHPTSTIPHAPRPAKPRPVPRQRQTPSLDVTDKHNVRVETVLLGKLIDNSIDLVRAVTIIEIDHFWAHHNKKVFAAIWACRDREGTITQVMEQLIASKDLDILPGKAAYLTECVKAAEEPGDVLYFARIIRDLAHERELDLKLAQLNNARRDGADISQIATGLVELIERSPGIASQAPEPVFLDAVPTYPDIAGPLAGLVSRRGGLQAGLVGGAGLGAAATCIPTAKLAVSGNWTVYPSLWIPLMAPPGAGKSPALEMGVSRLRELDAEVGESYADEMSTWDASGGTLRPGDKPPLDPSVVVGDTTLEALARRLRDNGGAAVMLYDEVSIMLRGLGEYKSGGANGDRGRLLSLWASSPWQYNRVGGNTSFLVKRPIVTILGGLQTTFHRLLGSEDDGLRPRWLPHLATLDQRGQEEGGFSEPTPEWDALIERLYRDRSPRVWVLGRAEDQWRHARRRWKVTENTDEETASTKGALAKADQQCLRVALVLAELESPGKGGELPHGVMGDAIKIVDYALNGWRALGDSNLLELSKREVALDAAVEKLLAFVEESGGRALKRSISRSRVAGCRRGDQVEALIACYEETFPGCVREEKPEHGGRTQVVVYAPERRRR